LAALPVKFTPTLATAWFLTCLLAIPALSQNGDSPLKNILPELEHRNSITFSYADETINGITIAPPSKKFSLTETLNYLQEKSGLVFKQISERYISISKAKQQEAPTICGTIASADMHEWIAGATITPFSWKDLTGGIRYSVSNDRGYFEMKSEAFDSVQIRYLGFYPKMLSVKDFIGRDCQSILLEPQFTALHEIVVMDFITDGIEKRTDGALDIKTGTLGMLPGLTEPDVLQTIQTLPGIESINESISDINVRGGTNDQNLVLWDGIKMYQTGHFFGLISALNPYITSSGTLIKNGSSAILGEGVSSTIDFRTSDKLASKFSGGAGFNLINSDAFVVAPLSKKMSVQFAARRSTSDLVLTPTYKNYFDRAFINTDVVNGQPFEDKERFYFYDVSLKFLYDISPRDKVRVSVLNIANDLEFQETQTVNATSITKTSSLAQQSLAMGLNYARFWNDRLKTTAQAYLSRYDLDAVNHDISNAQRLEQDNEVLDTGIKLDARYSLNSKVDLVAGYQFFEVGVYNLEDIDNPRFRRAIKEVLRSHAAFAEGNLDLGEKTSVRIGVRANFFPEFKKTIVEPRLAFNQQLGENFYWEILSEMKNQANAQIIDLQNDFLGIEKRRWALSNNTDIPIVRSKQISNGFYYKRKNTLVSVDGYYKEVDGIITSSQGFQNQFQFVRSSGSYSTYGLDFLVNQKFNRFATWMSYSHASNSYTFNTLIPPSFPHNLDLRHMAAIGANYKTARFEISTGLNWRTGKPLTLPIAGNEVTGTIINFSTPNNARLPEYWRLDFSVKYYFNISPKLKAQTGISIWNVLNRENVINQYYFLNTSNQADLYSQQALSLTPNFFFRVSF
jgi:TonB dependent receptor/TonB-dependent Receptor Plug Domain